MTAYARMRSRLAEIVLRRDTGAGTVFDWTVQILIIASLFVFAFSTLPDLDPADRRMLETAEGAILAVFFLEYLLRIWVSENPRRYVFSFFGIVDLLALAPALLLMTTSTGMDLIFVRCFRLLRLMLIVKSVRSSEIVRRLKLAWEQIRDEMVIYGTASLIILFVAAAGIYFFENGAVNKTHPDAFKSVFHSLWWAVTTLISVENGDIVPVTTGGKIFTFFIAVAGIGVVAVPTALLASALTSIKKSEDS